MHKKTITQSKKDVDNVLAPDTNVEQCYVMILAYIWFEVSLHIASYPTIPRVQTAIYLEECFLLVWDVPFNWSKFSENCCRIPRTFLQRTTK